jgi:hypothetical protein
MSLRVLWFITLMLASLTTAMSFSHLLEMAPRLEWNAELWVGTTVTGGLYRLFGTVGAVVETSNWVAVAVLAVLLRRDRPAAFGAAALGAALFIAAFVLWWVFVFPANAEIAGWTSQTVPTDWRVWRDQWEFAHATRAALHLAALAALFIAVIAASPVSTSSRNA